MLNRDCGHKMKKNSLEKDFGKQVKHKSLQKKLRKFKIVVENKFISESYCRTTYEVPDGHSGLCLFYE